MSIFNIISLLGGLAMFLYGMRLMGDNLKEGSSGTLKIFMEKVTNNPIKAFALGVLVTAIIQSSTATIVITSGLVAAGVITLRQSLGVIIGANVGTTVTGQIIRFIGIDADGASILRLFQPSTLAPLALIIGIVCIMFLNFRRSNVIGNICIGFGILFSGLLNMTSAVSVLSENGLIDGLFQSLGDHMWMGYLVGAGVAFMLQSSSATIGILQAFSLSGVIPFKAVYIVLCGIYLGDCVTTAIVCSIGAKPDQKRVGVVNILFNLSETVLVLIVVLVLKQAGVLDGLWNAKMSPGTIANTNTIFNLTCAIVLLPAVNLYEKASLRIVKDEVVPVSKYADKLTALNPVFFQTPALAFNSCYDLLRTMLNAACENINKALDTVFEFDEKKIKEIYEEEKNINMLTDRISNYLSQLTPYAREEKYIRIMDQYNRVVTEFERLGDQAKNIAQSAEELKQNGSEFSKQAKAELQVIRSLMNEIFVFTKLAFEKRDVDAAQHIEPLEEVMDDMTNALHNNHLIRLRDGICTTHVGISFLDILSNLEKIADICSNVGISVIVRVHPEIAAKAHSYVSALHQNTDNTYQKRYEEAHESFFGKLSEADRENPDIQAADMYEEMPAEAE
ncbi:MAG: Na/Pi cotransporter family protein [Eubacterium sp.]|nr:Na/Pi cotransporter family protein [Eubacterium sp.]